MVSQILQCFRKIDILVNNAGLHRGRRVHKLPVEDWDLVLNSHLKGAFLISSFVGIMGWPGDTAYASAKAGLIGFTRALAKESIDAVLL